MLMIKHLISLVIFSLILFIFLASNSSPAQAGTIVLREGKGCSQDVVKRLSDTPEHYNLKNFSGTNDEARSLELNSVEAGTKILVFDHPRGRRSDDWSEIYVSKFTPFRCVSSFEDSFGEAVDGDSVFGIEYHPHNGLNGKVSRVEVSKFF
jgi:hypothetical protein